MLFSYVIDIKEVKEEDTVSYQFELQSEAI